MGPESGVGTGMGESEQIDVGRSSLERAIAKANGASAVARPRAGALQESTRLDGITCSASSEP